MVIIGCFVALGLVAAQVSIVRISVAGGLASATVRYVAAGVDSVHWMSLAVLHCCRMWSMYCRW